MGKVPQVTPQAGIGGAELPQLGALARYTQAAIGQDGKPVKAVAGAKASGTITIATIGDVNATETVTVGEAILTFVASDPAAGEVLIGTAGETRDNLLAALQGVAAAEGVEVEASSTAAIKVTALAAGVAGNAVALATTSTGVTVSGAVLAGGVDQVLGTVAPAGAIRIDGTDLWVATADSTATDTSGWKKVTVSGSL